MTRVYFSGHDDLAKIALAKHLQHSKVVHGQLGGRPKSLISELDQNTS